MAKKQQMLPADVSKALLLAKGAFFTLAEDAGDEPIWNKGGKAYEASQAVKGVLEKHSSRLTSAQVNERELISAAKRLLEPGEESLNPEYTRALIELIMESCGYSQDDKPAIARKLGIKEKEISKVV